MNGERPVSDYRISRFVSDRICKREEANLSSFLEKLFEMSSKWVKSKDNLPRDAFAPYKGENGKIFTEISTSFCFEYLNRMYKSVKEIPETKKSALDKQFNYEIQENEENKELIMDLVDRSSLDFIKDVVLNRVQGESTAILKKHGLLNALFEEGSEENETMKLFYEMSKVLFTWFSFYSERLRSNYSLELVLFLDQHTELPRYIIHKEFFKEFTTVDISKVTGDALPQDKYGLIKLPLQLRSDDDTNTERTSYIEEFFFECRRRTDGKISVKIMALEFECYRTEVPSEVIRDVYRVIRDVYRVYFEIDPDEEIKKYLKKRSELHKDSLEDGTISLESKKILLENYGPGWLETHQALEKFFLSMLVYLNTGTPDIRGFQNTIRYKTKQDGKKHKKVVKREDLMLCPYPVFLVGYNWKKGDKVFRNSAEYDVKSWMRRGGYVNQPCGKGRSERRWQYRRGGVIKRNPELAKKLYNEENVTGVPT